MQISSYFCEANLAILADVVLAQDIGSLPARGSDLISQEARTVPQIKT